ncbi:MAG: hypothetical protein DHS20C06_06470 [Hyphobacterium sp.]|nr:MAG: hypothetical protein DHS20C06_06470 [Hyphobacterium sp.]
MGGYGSGRAGWRNKVEECRSLDVNRLHREGCLAPGYSGGWNWMRDGESIANISMHSNGLTLTLEFRVSQNGSEWKDICQPIRLDSTPCRFGGSRPWFICPGVGSGRRCGRRVAKLHAGGTYFLCRHCYQLGYASQSEQEFDRLLRRANKLRTSLGGEPGTGALIARKPKGMHWKTYDARVAEIDQLEESANKLFIAAHQHRWPDISLFL